MTNQNRADLCIAQKALTNSKRPSTFVEGVYPTHATHGFGAHIYANKKPYIDYYGGLGANLLGYGNPQIRTAISERYALGSCLSLSSELELDLAEILKGMFGFVDLWKFTKTGSEACGGALKIARAYTGRKLVLSDGYHGNFDDFVSMTPPALGIPEREWMAPLDLSRVKDAAAVIIEPVLLDYGIERRLFLQELRDECTKHGTVLIFDEIITGFRFPKFSVSNYFGIHPDILLLGKALGGGLPLSAIGGKKEIMNCGEYFLSGTFFGETTAFAAAKTLIGLIHRESARFDLNDLWASGQIFLDKFNALSLDLKIRGYPTRGAFQGDQKVKALFWQEACLAGILFGPSWFYNFPLMELTDMVIPICRDIFNRISTNSVQLLGAMPRPPYAQELRKQ